MEEEDPNENKEKTSMSFKDKLKLFEQKGNVYDKLENKNRTTPYSKLVQAKPDSEETDTSKLSQHSEPSTDEKPQTKIAWPPDDATSVHSSGKILSPDSSSIKSDYLGSDEYVGKLDYLDPQKGLNKQTKEVHDGKIQNKPKDKPLSDQRKPEVAEAASEPPPLPPRPHMAKLTKTSLSNTYAEIGDINISSLEKGESSSSKSDDNGGTGGTDQYEIQPPPTKQYLTEPLSPENKSSSKRSDISDYKGSDEYNDSSPEFVSPGPRINQGSQSPKSRTNETQQEDRCSEMDQNNSNRLSKSPQNKPQPVPRAVNLSHDTSSNRPSNAPQNEPPPVPRAGNLSPDPSSNRVSRSPHNDPQSRIKQKEINQEQFGPSVVREIPRGHGAPTYYNQPSHHGSSLLSTEGHGLPGKGHGIQAYGAERDLNQNEILHFDIGIQRPVPMSTDRNAGMQYGAPPPYHQTRGQHQYGPGLGPIFQGHQHPGFTTQQHQWYPEHNYPGRPPIGYPQHFYQQHPPVWQHGQHIYGPADGRQSPDWQHFPHPTFQNVIRPQNPHMAGYNVSPNTSRSLSPLTATLQPDVTRTQSPHPVTQNLPNVIGSQNQSAGMPQKEDKGVDRRNFKLGTINAVCEMGYKHDQVEKTVENIFTDEESYGQSQDLIIGKILDMLQKEQPTAPRKMEKTKIGPEKTEKPKTNLKEKQAKKKECPGKEKVADTSFICIKGLEEKHLDEIIKREKFCNFLEKLVDVDVDRSSLFHDGDELAIVAFLGNPDIGLLTQELKKKHYEGVYIDICEVKPSKSIVVSGACDSISKRDIENYFRDHHKSGGGHVVSCDEEDGIYIICFRSHTDVENVCQGVRRHKIETSTLYVSPRFECKFGDIWDTTRHKVVLPTQISITGLNSHFSKFISYSSTCCEEINRQMQSNFARVCSSFDADNLCIKCLLTQSSPDVRKLSKSWESNVRRKFDDLVTCLLDRKEIMCSSSVWESFKEQLKNIKNDDSQEFILIENDENCCIFIVGMKYVVQSQYDELLCQKQNIETELERKSKIKTEEKTFKPGEVMLLENDGIITKVNKIAEDLEVVIGAEKDKIKFTGMGEDILKAQLKILEILNEKDETDVTGLTEQQMKLIKNEFNIKLIQRQFEDKNIKAYVNVNGDELKIISLSGADNAEQIVKDFSKESIIKLDDDAITVLSKDVWTEKIKEIKQKHREKVLIDVTMDGKVTITTAADIHSDVQRELKILVDQHTTHVECIEVEKEGHYIFLFRYLLDDLERLQNDLKTESIQITMIKEGIEISGTSSGIKLAKSKVNAIIDGIREKKIEHKRPGIRYVLCHNNMERLQLIGEQSRTAILLEDDNGEDSVPQASGMSNVVKCKHGISISIIEDDIANAKADVLVCTTSTQLDLSSGKACRSLANAAGGNTLQRNCDAKYPKGIKEGEIASVKGGNLHCKKVYFGAFPQWKPGDNQPLQTVFKFMQNCFIKAEKAGFTSLAFLALGTGACGYPATSVAEVMYSCITDFDKDHQKSKIRTVGFVVHHKDVTTLKAFKDEEDKIRAGTVHVGIKCKNGTQIQLVTGELGKEEGDVIVCGISHDLNLSAGKASANLLNFGGQNLQKECKKNYPQGIESGQIAVVKGSKLKCQEVYFGFLPEWKTEQAKHHKTLWKFVESCMLKAHESGHSTVVFAALGTGALGYPPERAAHLMFDSVIKFDNCHSRSNVNNVKFVLYHKDQQTIKGFQQKEKEILKLSQPGGQGNWSRRQAKVQATATTGQIEKQKVDVIICCTGPKLDLSQGKVNQALVSEGGASLQAECRMNYPQGIQMEEIADIGPGNLSCKRVYLGVLPKYGTNENAAKQALHKFVSKCMYRASKAGYHSIAIPAVGTGKYNQYPHQVVASVIFEAVDKFDRKNSSTSLKDFRCVSVSGDKKSCQAFKMEERKRYVPSVTRATRKKFYHGGSYGATQESCRGNELSLFLYSDSDENIKQAEHEIDQYCKSEIMEKTINDRIIQHLPREELLAIENFSMLHPIRLDINKQRNEIILEGRIEDILQVKDEINKILRDCEKDHHSEKEAKMLAEKIQWHFKERQSDGDKLIPYSSKINLRLEKAFKGNMQVEEFISNDGTKHKVDFKKMQEYPVHNTADRVVVVRREKISASTFPLPKEWSDMGDTEYLKEEILKSSSSEYKQVEKLFKDSVFNGKFQGSYSQSTFSVCKIIRIQNKYLYQQYEAKKNHLKHQNPPTTKNEQTLWHGTGSAAIKSINYNGFNRSYCATANDAWYGNGVYFANDAGYSCADWASKPDATGMKYMYMVRVLTGKHCKGEKGMRVLPVRTGNILYDSAVETLVNPTEFIIFNDTQAYPQYIIHFKL